MKNPLAGQSIGRHVNLGRESVRDIFFRAVDLYRDSRLFALSVELQNADPHKVKLAVFGSTSFAQIFARAARARGFEPIVVVDDFRSGLECAGTPIVKSQTFLELARANPGLVAVNGGRTERAVRHFERLARTAGIPILTFEQGVRFFNLGGAVDYRVEDWGGEIARDPEAYLKIEERAADDYTKKTLYSILLFHLTGCMEWIHAVSRPYPTLYFRSGLFTLGDSERFVDCGASIGESTGGLLALTGNRVDRVWMFEPDKYNQAKLRTLIAELPADTQRRLSLHEVAVGECAGRLPFNHVGGHEGSIASENHSYGDSGAVDIRPIDEVVDQAPTLIKMDIEGAELAALKGAKRSIGSAHPTMAISAYHRATDLIDLPRWVLSVRDDYLIGLRHHTEERFDTCLYFLPV